MRSCVHVDRTECLCTGNHCVLIITRSQVRGMGGGYVLSALCAVCPACDYAGVSTQRPMGDAQHLRPGEGDGRMHGI